MSTKETVSPFRIEKMDAIEFLKTLPNNSVDLLYADPYYAAQDKWRAVGTTARRKDMAFVIFPESRFQEFITEAHRVLKKPGHLYMHCDEETCDLLKPLIKKSGLTYHKALVWHKQAIGMGYHYRAAIEYIIFAEKGKKLLNNLGVPDWISVKRLKGPQYYPHQKPLELLQIIIENSSKEGDVVCDPFMGSGTTGLAAIRSDRTFLGCDIADEAIARTTERLNKEVERRKEGPSPRLLAERQTRKEAADRREARKNKAVMETAAINPEDLVDNEEAAA